MKQLTLALCVLATVLTVAICAPVAEAATIEGNLYYTTFAGPPNVWTVHFTYVTATSMTYGSSTAINSLGGADGIVFNPNNANLLVGEQDHNKVAQVTTTALAPFVEVLASHSAADPQAFHLVVTPDRSTLLTMPNEVGNPGGSSINTVPLTPFVDGTAHTVTGLDVHLKGIAFIGSTAYYGNADDDLVNGYLGVLDLTNYTTTRLLTIVDNVDHTASQGSLPSHGMTFDPFTGDLIMNSGNQIWQVAISGTTAHIVAKIATNTGGNWDQNTVDGAGHLFVANNDGYILFVDYSASHLISSPVYRNEQFLNTALDDIADRGGLPAPTTLPGRMTGGGSVFETDGTRVTHGFELHCEIDDVPNRLEINWGIGNRFHLDTLTSAFCFVDPNINSGHPAAPFNTYQGVGTGSYNGTPGATATWTFTDAGEPGKNDMATITINDANSNVVLTVSGTLKNGNQQAHIDNK
jgi:hypothetical protein